MAAVDAKALKAEIIVTAEVILEGAGMPPEMTAHAMHMNHDPKAPEKWGIALRKAADMVGERHGCEIEVGWAWSATSDALEVLVGKVKWAS